MHGFAVRFIYKSSVDDLYAVKVYLSSVKGSGQGPPDVKKRASEDMGGAGHPSEGRIQEGALVRKLNILLPTSLHFCGLYWGKAKRCQAPTNVTITAREGQHFLL